MTTVKENILAMTKKGGTNYIKDKLHTNDAWLIRSILAIYDRQTALEQSAEETVEDNGVGFNGIDAGILSSFAKQIKKFEAMEKPVFPSPLSPKQMAIARKKMPKYSGQLLKIVAGEV